MPNNNLRLLNTLYQTATMGTSSINHILDKIDNTSFRQELKDQLEMYHDECHELREDIYAEHAEPKDVSAMVKACADMGITFHILMDDTPSNIAKMIIQGTNMGIISIREALNEASSASPEIKRKAEKMMKAEQKYIERIKPYL